MKYSIADDVKKIAEKIVDIKFEGEWERLDVSHINLNDIVFIRLDKNKTKEGLEIYAQFVKLNPREKFFSNYKYSIECMPLFDKLSTKGKVRTIHHELLHNPERNKSKLIPHDITDFKIIIKKYGLETK